MKAETFEKCCLEAFEIAKLKTPIDTGNLRYNALQIEFENGGNRCVISVNEDIAPYMVYTDKPWVAEKWNGAKNPNENWWKERFFDTFLKEFTRALGDLVKSVEVKNGNS